MHLQAIRQKFVEGAKRLSERESKEGKELSFKSLERQNVSKIDSFYFKPEKSSSNGDIFGSGGNASKIKINISD